ncbi:MAG: hypothetical protein J5911_03385 [Clostridia bacterium]|nr:hypothetical protein [Clostridia bacterium]
MDFSANNEKLKFDQEILKNRVNRYEKTCKIFYVILASFCSACILYLLIAWLFLGAFKVFDLTFSLPEIINWLENLPNAPTNRPVTSLIKLFIGIAFFIAYIIITILLIKQLVKALKYLTDITDIKNSRINHRALTCDVVKVTVYSFRLVVKTILITFAISAKIDTLPVVTLFLYALFFLFTNILQDLDLYYDVDKGLFAKKYFSISVTKSTFTISIALILLAVTARGQLYEILSGADVLLYTKQELPTIKIVEMFLLPAIGYFLYLQTDNVLKLILKYKPETLNRTAAENEMANYMNKTCSRIIFFACVLLLAKLFFLFVSPEGQLFLPDDLKQLALNIAPPIVSIILLAISTKIITPIKKPFLKQI